MPSATLVAAIVVLSAGVLTAQVPSGQPTPGQPVRPQAPARDRQTVTGTAVIRGQVVDAATGAPIRRAQVSIYAGREPVAAQTDGEGRFELHEVPSGKHTLNVFKSGYLSLFATNSNKPVPPIEVKDGDVVERIVVRISRGGVISGQVVDEFGEPFIGAEVRALRYGYRNGQRQLNPVGGLGPLGTDDLGGFRIYGLEPGEYYLSVRGRDFNMYGRSAAVGEGPAPTYYPGTTNVTEARRVTVRAGRETQGVVFPVAFARLSRVRGRVVSSSGESFAGMISAVQRDGIENSSRAFGPVRPDGTFEVANLPPGTYTLVARPSDFPPDTDGESGRVVVTVDGETIDNVLIATSKGGTARGRVVTDDGTPLSAMGTGLNVFPQPADPGEAFSGRRPVRVNADGSFEVTNLFDRIHLRVSFTPAGPPTADGIFWTLKAVLVGGQDITDEGLEVRSGHAVEDVHVVYTRRASRISGRLKNSRGEQAQGWIVVFAADEAKWKPQSRFVRVSRPGPDGEYRITLTPHDDYLMIGVNGIEDGQWQDPEFLRSVKDHATRFAIGENETKTQDVTLVEWRR
jgi:hypothetical protein